MLDQNDITESLDGPHLLTFTVAYLFFVLCLFLGCETARPGGVLMQRVGCSIWIGTGFCHVIVALMIGATAMNCESARCLD